jgi:ABC-type polar amino acid transport system ATPase subunit
MQGHVALEVEGLHKSFDGLHVLRGIDLAVDEHEVVCLIGASGSGKSTFLRCVNLLETIDAGRISIEGEEITAPGVDVNRIRQRVGIVFQAFNLFPHMSVMRNVTLGPTEALRMSRPRPNRSGSSCSSASDWPTSATTIRTSSPVGSSSAWRSSGRSP